MANKKVTRRALTMSIISLILCCAMLVGTTFAWFTDKVESGMNTIQAGNLDIELLANGEEVTAGTKLFDDVTLWEPGVVVYENLQIANVGTLALKYQMTLNFGNENDLNGHKLSEVLKVVVLDQAIASGTTRESVLKLAEDALAEDQGNGTLSNFYQTGMLAPKDQTMTVGAETITDKTAEQAVVIFWEPNANATDNLYNANNGQITSDGNPLSIEFGINLQATQQMNEEDSFGNDYDEFSSILPKATVNNVSAKYPTVMATDGIGGAASEIPMDFALQFLPNETLEEAESNGYRYWHADYVIKADKPVKANSMALAGYYEAWCSLNNDNWVALTSDQDIAANTEIRLVELLGRTVNYEEICQFGNDGTGFLCGAADLTGKNAGTTITVELRLYETTKDPNATSGTANEEVLDENGNPVYVTVGTYSYTFGGSWVNLDDGTVLFNDGEGDIQLYSVADVTAADYTVPEAVTSLRSGVFAGNTSINSVTIPASVTDFGATEVSDTGASSGAFKGSAVATVVLEEGMKEIPAAAFNGAKNLTSVTIPSTVTTVGVNAFRQTALTTLTIPATLTNISHGAFRDMTNLETVTFEGTHVDIPNYAFRGCTNLRTVNLKNADTATIGTNMAFCNASSNNSNTNNITFYCKTEAVADLVKASMGVGSYVAIYVADTLYAEIK